MIAALSIGALLGFSAYKLERWLQSFFKTLLFESEDPIGVRGFLATSTAGCILHINPRLATLFRHKYLGATIHGDARVHESLSFYLARVSYSRSMYLGIYFWHAWIYLSYNKKRAC